MTETIHERKGKGWGCEVLRVTFTEAVRDVSERKLKGIWTNHTRGSWPLLRSVGQRQAGSKWEWGKKKEKKVGLGPTTRE